MHDVSIDFTGFEPILEMAGQIVSLILIAKVNPGNLTSNNSRTSQLPDVSAGDWYTLKEAFVGTARHQLLSFSNAHIISYFVVRTAVDGMLASDFKAINKCSLN